MRRARIGIPFTFALLLASGGTAGAEEGKPAPEQRARRSSEILAHIDQPEAGKSWLAHHLDRVRIDGKSGLRYARPLAFGKRDLELELRGPAMGRKRFGVSFELRF
jgi:hypothetical protein